MADKEAQQKLYAYGEMSNKVQQAERSMRRRTDASGEVESLRGRNNIGRMGDRVAASSGGDGSSSTGDAGKRPAEIEEIKERAKKKRMKRGQASGVDVGKKRGTDNILMTSGGRGILDLGELSGYQPTHAGSQASYEGLLNMIKLKDYLGNQPTAILVDAANEIITTLKDDSMRDPERHDMISKILTGKGSRGAGALSTAKFATLVTFGKGIDDYGLKQTKNDVDEEQVDDEMGVAVVFDDSDEEGEDGNKILEEGSDVDEDVVVDAASTSSSEPEDGNSEDEGLGGGSDEELLVQDESNENGDIRASSNRRKHAHNRSLSVHEIDAHYLQRRLASHYDDATVCAQIANDVLDILDISTERISDRRECENKLLVLLESELFDLIKLILNNRVRIWACVSLKRAKDDAEREGIETVLKNDPTGEGKRIWEELHSNSKAEDWSREKMS